MSGPSHSKAIKAGMETGVTRIDLVAVCSACDASLIAAAPELLEALCNIVASLSEHDDEGMIEHAQQMVFARAAIDKATGVKK